MPDEERVPAPERIQPVLEGPEVAHEPIGEGALPRRRDPARSQEARKPRDARRIEDHVGLEAALSVRRFHQEVKRALRAQWVARVVAPSHPGASDRDDPVPLADPIREERRLRDRLQHPLHHLGSGQQGVVRREEAVEQLPEPGGHVHPERAEESRRAPAREGVADVLSLEHGHLVTPLGEAERGREPDRPGAHDRDATVPAARGQPFRVMVLHAWTQWAIVPPPRIAAATLTASAISSGLMPASEQAEA